MFKRFFFNRYFFIFLVIIFGVFGYFSFKNSSNTILVKSYTVSSNTVYKTVSGTGVIKSQKEAALNFPVMGTVTALNVSKGDTVFSGQVLAQLYNFDIYQSVQATKENIEIARHDRDLFIRRYEKDKSTVGGNRAYDLELAKLNDMITRAEATYSSAQAGLRNYYLYAPFNGTIVDTFIKAGETAGIGSGVVKLADLNDLVFEMNVDQEDFGLVKIGQSVEITLDSYSNATLQGTVYKLPYYADLAQNTFKILVKVESTDILVLLGMRGNAKIIIDSSGDNTVSLLFDSIFYDVTHKPYIWVDRDNKIFKKYIETGIEGDIYVEILSDINDKIVVPVKDIEKVVEGNKVKYQP